MIVYIEPVGVMDDSCQPLSLKALCTLPPVFLDDHEEDDFETLRVIQRRFSAYNSAELMPCEGFPDSEEACNNHHLLKDNVETLPSCSIQWQQSEEYNMYIVSQKDSNFPKSAQLFIDAIKKNRSYQNFIRNFCRWLNFEDPLINHNPWAVEEDKNLLLIIQEKGIRNWFDISVSLGTNRTPFQCLARYQRSLNVPYCTWLEKLLVRVTGSP
ncbi:hypothetical protein Pint_16995 [Pistacia integerrima]|uniref:Uncharacterized protein n=1 Tax=Pistacia integerrima TaxID=434235 RepID=A0ACC0ZD88_9ROSI|nr:hypothetical protein Pint_16995 [Pistacia integerrima]